MLSRGCWPCLVAIAAAASFGPAVAQNPYETANLRARVLSAFDRDQDGELSMLELRNATVRAAADRAAALQSLAQGTLETEASASIWDAEAMSRLAIGHAGRWLSAQESLPVMGENGLVSDASLMRELTPWEQTGGLELLNEGTALSSGATAPAETHWWLKHPLMADPAAVEAQPNGTPATP